MSEVFSKYLISESSSGGKFWEVLVNDSNMSIRYGKIGQDKSWKTTGFASHALAVKEATKKMNSKLKKGYVEGEGGADGGAVPTPAAERSFDELFGEIRSLLEGKVKKADMKQVKKFYNAIWEQDKDKAEAEIDPYLYDKFADLPYTYFSHKVEQVGRKGSIPAAIKPLFDADDLKLNPFAKFSRELKHRYNGRYMPGDDVEPTSYHEEYWIGQAFSLTDFVANPVNQNIESLYFDYKDMCEMQSYSNLMYPVGIKTLISNLPKLKHLQFANNWQTRRCGEVFHDAGVIAKLETLWFSDSGNDPGDLKKIATAESLSELTTLQVGFAGRGSRDGFVPDELKALAESTVITKLKHFSMHTDGWSSAEFSEVVRGSKVFEGLDVLEFYGGTIEQGFLDALCQEGENKWGLKELHLGVGPSISDILDEMEGSVCWKTLVIQLNWRWDNDSKSRLESVAKKKKFKVKFKKYVEHPF